LVKKESAVGFVLVDTRTKEVTFTKQGGATEYAAQSFLACGRCKKRDIEHLFANPHNTINIPTLCDDIKMVMG
jgi:hypothetical protein